LERAKASADHDFARQEHARIAALRKQELATNAEVAAAALAEANARAVLDGIEARIGNSSGELKAAEDGLVAVVDAQQGDIVAAGGALLHLADRAGLRVRLGIEPKDLAGLREGQPVVLTAIYEAGIQVRGHITKRISRIDPGSQLAEALVAIDTGSALLPGAMVKAAISLEVPADVIAVPRSAVLRKGQRDYVFVVRDNKAVRAWVDTGRESDTLVEIRTGVAAGDAVVVEGNYELTDGMAVKVEATKQ
jgi:RND family efflux transporter MFP subunit